ncbi:ABC transporter substrate-binding protein [Aquabacterium sp. OR-4]|uniref:ABC transporter substrate-binding protein n=1 Tax=Aquabacterium sp. OR-4 TaxID=2978127 RepID=UPI0021B3E421|nr:ABC transporter substrate-binding protein [Aquabacterium sp. OR-4]MDT7836019.1 ABC transporter substrate-binding protein [Aquabacterium sp. OR-4]
MTKYTSRRAALGAALGFLAPKAFANDAGVSPREVLFGQSAVLSGPLGVSVQGYNAGAQLAFDEANASGGVAGRRISLLTLDDGLAADRAAANYKSLLAERGVFGFFGAVGSGTTAAAVPLLRESNAPLIGNFALSDAVREQAAGQAYFVRATYGREAARLMQHLATIGIQRLALAHLDNPGGVEVLGLVRAAAQQAGTGISVVAAAAVRNDGSNLVQAAQQLGAAKAQALLMFLSGPPVAQLMRALDEAGASPACYGMSVVAGDAVAKTLGDKLRGLAIAQVMPYPWSELDATARQYRAACAKAQVPVAYHTYEGYLNALVLLEGLRRCGRALSRSALHEQMRSLRSRIAGIDIDFNGRQHTGSRFVELVHVTQQGRYIR